MTHRQSRNVRLQKTKRRAALHHSHDSKPGKNVVHKRYLLGTETRNKQGRPQSHANRDPFGRVEEEREKKNKNGDRRRQQERDVTYTRSWKQAPSTKFDQAAATTPNCSFSLKRSYACTAELLLSREREREREEYPWDIVPRRRCAKRWSSGKSENRSGSSSPLYPRLVSRAMCAPVMQPIAAPLTS